MNLFGADDSYTLFLRRARPVPLLQGHSLLEPMETAWRARRRVVVVTSSVRVQIELELPRSDQLIKSVLAREF